MRVARSVSPSARPRSNSYLSFVRVTSQREAAPMIKPRASVDAGSKTSMGRILTPITTKRATKTHESPKIWLAAETCHHAFVNLPRHAHVVQIVLADLLELAGLVQIKHFAAFHFRGLARFNSESPRNIVETHMTPRAKPPTMHRVEHAAHVVIRQVHKRPHLNLMHQTTLKDKRQVEPENVVPDEFVAIAIEVFH